MAIQLPRMYIRTELYVAGGFNCRIRKNIGKTTVLWRFSN